MTSEVSLEGIKKAVFFAFHEKNWSDKVLIGAAINFANFVVPMIPLIVLLGFMGQMMKRIIVMGEDPELPEWKEWGNFFLDGIKMFGVLVIYSLPGILVEVFGYFLIFVVGIGMNFLAIASAHGNTPYMFPFSISMLASVLGTMGGILVMWIGIFIFMISMVFFEPAVGNLIAKSSFGAAFRFKEWWPVFKMNLTGYLVVSALMFGMTFALLWLVQFLYMTLVLCILLPFIVGFLGFIIGAAGFSLSAVAYWEGMQMLARNAA